MNAVDIADMVEFAVNETKPEVKTHRGIGNKFIIEIDGKIFIVEIKEHASQN